MTVLMDTITHIPVLPEEVIRALVVWPGGRYVDATVGGGGHTLALLEACGPQGQVLGLDKDPHALAVAQERLAPWGSQSILLELGFEEMNLGLERHAFSPVDGVLFDLGVSSLQLADPGRGFSFQGDGPLDMRYSPWQSISADQLVNHLPERELAHLLRRCGEEPASGRIARAIVAQRPLHTTGELAALIERVLGGRRGDLHPATRSFLALRIAVNQELWCLERGLELALEALRPGGRLAVISFHSLEDRLVKGFLRREAQGCLCPPRLPECRCGHKPRLRLITRKPITPGREELARNPRSRSAKLRVAERLYPQEQGAPGKEEEVR